MKVLRYAAALTEGLADIGFGVDVGARVLVMVVVHIPVLVDSRAVLGAAVPSLNRLRADADQDVIILGLCVELHRAVLVEIIDVCGVPIRLFGNYVRPLTDYFEFYAGITLRRILIRHFLGDCSRLIELGCGTGAFAATLLSNHLNTDAEVAQPTSHISY